MAAPTIRPRPQQPALARGARRRLCYINGPNLNLLGTREPEIYGSDTLEDLAERCRAVGAQAGFAVDFLQSNHEGQLVDWIQAAISATDAIVINAAAYTHTSIAIHDASRAYDGFAVELHISNPHARETFRHHSYVAPAADAVVMGIGSIAYDLIIPVLSEMLPVSPAR